jgi:hypothetical protein
VGESIGPAVPVIHRFGTADSDQVERAKHLVLEAVAAIEVGRWSDAIRELRQARDQWQALIQAAPGQAGLAGELGRTLVYFGGALRNERHPEEALLTVQQARQVLEAIRRPSPEEPYGLARAYSLLTTLVEPGSARMTFDEREALADRAMAALRQSLAAGMTDLALIGRDHDLDSLCDRPDFRALILDWGFPVDPFAGP